MVSEQVGPVVRLAALPEGTEVVEDCGRVGLTLRRHPVAFPRAEVAKLVLVRQYPGLVKGVLFITVEDETGAVNLVVWTKVFEAHRRVVLGASMMGVPGRIQREVEVVHLVGHSLTDLSREFASVRRRSEAIAGDANVAHPPEKAPPRLPPAKTMADSHRPVVDEIRARTPDFR